MDDVKLVVAKNILALRKSKDLTQGDLGKYVHYSDKAVSRWEKGESLPDIETLQEVANVFGVKIGYLFEDHSYEHQYGETKNQTASKIACVVLSVLIVWLIALFVFLYLGIYNKVVCWQVFVWSVPASCLVLKYFNKRWRNGKNAIVISSIFIWSFIASIYCQFISYNLWLIFFVCAPVQVVLILNNFIKSIRESEKRGKQ